MAQIHVTGIDGTQRAVTIATGMTAMEAIRDNGFEELLALCGGGCACATCHVYVAEEWLGRLPRPSDDEDDLLDSSDHRKANSRLGCQIVLGDALGGLRVTIAPGD